MLCAAQKHCCVAFFKVYPGHHWKRCKLLFRVLLDVHYVSLCHIIVTAVNWNYLKALVFKSCPFHTLNFSCQQTQMMLPGTQRQGANYQCASLAHMCSLVRFMSTEAYLRSVSKPLVLVPDNRDQRMLNRFRRAHSSSPLSSYQTSADPFLQRPISLILNKFSVAN